MILDFLKPLHNIVLVVHKNPDADSIGSASAFYSYLLRDNKNITFFCSSENIAKNLLFIPWSDKIKDRLPKDIDCIISFDCGDISRLGFETENYPIINFDHHKSNNNFGIHNIVDSDAISTTEVVYDFFVTNGIKINAKIATALYAGLVDDSDFFKSKKCNQKTFKMAHNLLENQADHTLSIEQLNNQKSLAYARLKSIMYSEMRLVNDGRFAIFDIDRDMFIRSGAYIADAKIIAAEALELATVEVALLLAQSKDDIVVSIRSSGIIDADAIASIFGGGGHKIRAGARVDKQDKERVIFEISKGLN